MGLNSIPSLILGKMLEGKSQQTQTGRKMGSCPSAALPQPPRLGPAGGSWRPLAVRISSRWWVAKSLGLKTWQQGPSWPGVPGRHPAGWEGVPQEAGSWQLASHRKELPQARVQGIQGKESPRAECPTRERGEPPEQEELVLTMLLLRVGCFVGKNCDV